MSVDTGAWQSMDHLIEAGTTDRRPRADMPRIRSFLRPYRARLALFAGLVAATSSLAVAAPVLAGHIVDAVVAGSAPGVIAGSALVIGVLAVLEAALGFVSRRLSAHIGESLVHDLRTRAFDHVQRLSIAFFTRTRTGALISRLSHDVTGAGHAFAVILPEALGNLMVVLATLVVMFLLSWPITLVALLSFPLFLLPVRRLGARLRPMVHEAADHNAAMGALMAERFSAPGAMLVKLLCHPSEESSAFAARAVRVRDIEVRIASVQAVCIAIVTLVSSLTLAVVYGVGGYFATVGHLEAGSVVALALLLSRIYGPLSALASARMEVVSGLVSFARVFEVLELDPLLTDAPDARDVPDGPVDVEFTRVRFGYPAAHRVSLASLEDVDTLDGHPESPVLTDVSFRVGAGETVALVGSSGAGKSTIAQLVPRLYDVDGGSVRLGGVDVRDLTADSIRRTVGMVTQDGHVFHDTVRANLQLADRAATDEQLWDALRRARLDAVIASFPSGLDTVIGERGYRLSGGERQRLTIARVLLAQPRVVILDEATAHLDSTSEEAVQAALREALTGRTAIVIAHRLSTIRAADQILVVEGGRIVERGDHDQLVGGRGRYWELCNASGISARKQA
ncbi:ABC transporter ATP-binding protein [Rhodococcus sp. NPDC003318]|uniref:ABC transporter ATP-binding protein n=1 Tax=Rhodococcus sp. NPDC003318 TaxID=3364503 RepID=UPI0036B04D49